MKNGFSYFVFGIFLFSYLAAAEGGRLSEFANFLEGQPRAVETVSAKQAADILLDFGSNKSSIGPQSTARMEVDSDGEDQASVQSVASEPIRVKRKPEAQRVISDTESEYQPSEQQLSESDSSEESLPRAKKRKVKNGARKAKVVDSDPEYQPSGSESSEESDGSDSSFRSGRRLAKQAKHHIGQSKTPGFDDLLGRISGLYPDEEVVTQLKASYRALVINQKKSPRIDRQVTIFEKKLNATIVMLQKQTVIHDFLIDQLNQAGKEIIASYSR